MAMLTLLLSLVFGTAHAGELAGVTLPDTATVGGQTLVLNGLGLREKYWIDIYVGALYLPAKTTDATKAIDDDVPKRMSMTFIYSHVTKAQLSETFEESFANSPDGGAATKDRFEKMLGWMTDVYAGDEVRFDYVPGTGTTVYVKGASKGTIEGADFMRAIWGVYLGPTPPTAKLKTGLLGG